MRDGIVTPAITTAIDTVRVSVARCAVILSSWSHSFPGESADAGYGLVAMFEVEGRRDLAVVRREVGRDQIFGGPRGPGAETTQV